jgi:hypothetical protein
MEKKSKTVLKDPQPHHKLVDHVKAAKAAPDPNNNPAKNVVILGDDGLFHLISNDEWLKAPVVDPKTDPGYPTLETLSKDGTYLAYLPTATPIGTVCTLVNLQSILKNNT